MQESVIYQDILEQGRNQEALSFCNSLLIKNNRPLAKVFLS